MDLRQALRLTVGEHVGLVDKVGHVCDAGPDGGHHARAHQHSSRELKDGCIVVVVWVWVGVVGWG